MKKKSKVYFAIGLNDSFEGKRKAGNITFSGNNVVFTYDGGEVLLPYNGIKVSEGGAGNNLVFFSNSMYPDWNIYTSDKSILNDPEIKNNSSFSGLKVARAKRNATIITLVLLLSLILTGTVYLIYWLRNSFSYAIASRIPIKWEESLGNTIYSSMISGKKMYTDEETLALLNPIVDPLKDAAKDSGYKFQFHIMEDPSLNAFALPGGHIVIHSELIRRSETPEEIAGVLAHEISHVTEKHGVRQIISSIGIFVVIQTFFFYFTGLLAILTQNSGLLLRTKFSRDFEREADAKGFHYLYHSKIDPSGMLEFFKKIQEQEKEIMGDSGEVLSFISTHPGTEERMEIMKEKIEKLSDKNFVPIKMKLKKLQKILKAKENN
ncbi:MAG: M48 family metallopeptidase [Leptospiraceae bacterium]|nr:M48 family metallopeptidase [Leptospiraceae bacterium]